MFTGETSWGEMSSGELMKRQNVQLPLKGFRHPWTVTYMLRYKSLT